MPLSSASSLSHFQPNARHRASIITLETRKRDLYVYMFCKYLSIRRGNHHKMLTMRLSKLNEIESLLSSSIVNNFAITILRVYKKKLYHESEMMIVYYVFSNENCNHKLDKNVKHQSSSLWLHYVAVVIFV